jgi:hypothetical protein
VLAVVLVVIFAILLPVTIVATWAHRTVVNTDAYVAMVGPIAANPAVQAAVSREVTNEIYAALNPQQVIVSSLPPKAASLAGSRFAQLWVAANRFAHGQLISALNGDSKALQTTNGHVVLNLVPLLSQALKGVQDQAPGLFGKKITLPAISATTNPAASCQKIAAAIGRPVPPTCGQIPLFPASSLTSAQRGFRAVNGIVLVLLIITPLVFLGALWASTRRRRTLLQLAIAGMLGLIVIRRVMYWLQSDLIAAAKPENRAAISVIAGQVLHGFFTVTIWFLIGGLVLTIAALLAGPYRWAVAFRSAAGHLASALGGHASDDRTVSWVRRHLGVLGIGGAVIAALALLIFSVNWVGVLVIAALLGLYELGLYRLRQAKPAT